MLKTCALDFQIVNNILSFTHKLMPRKEEVVIENLHSFDFNSEKFAADLSVSAKYS